MSLEVISLEEAMEKIEPGFICPAKCGATFISDDEIKEHLESYCPNVVYLCECCEVAFAIKGKSFNCHKNLYKVVEQSKNVCEKYETDIEELTQALSQF